jgi:hypothetical protein
MTRTLILDDATIDAIADSVIDRMRATDPDKLGPVLTVAEAMRLTKCKSLSAFYRWTKRKKVRPLEQGRYSTRRVLSALG